MTIDKFIEELKKINIELSNIQLAQLDTYYNLLVEWNEKINLTAITEKEQVYLKHFYDSLTLNKIIDLRQDYNLCDFGTGAGFPGLVLKIVFPNLKITLVDSLNKRINFLNLVIEKLGLTNIKTHHARIEEFAKDNIEKFDIVTARAVAPLNVLLEYAVPIVKVNGLFIPMKADIKEELINSKLAINKLDVEIIDKQEFLLPVENSKRTLISFKKNKSTNKKFPRKYSEIKKYPL